MHSSHNARAGPYSWMQSGTARILRPATVSRTHCPPKPRHRAKWSRAARRSAYWSCGRPATRLRGTTARSRHPNRRNLMLSRCVPFSGLQIHRAREKNVVFEMHMLMKVCVEFLEALVECPKSGAGAHWRRIGAAETANLL